MDTHEVDSSFEKMMMEKVVPLSENMEVMGLINEYTNIEILIAAIRLSRVLAKRLGFWDYDCANLFYMSYDEIMESKNFIPKEK